MGVERRKRSQEEFAKAIAGETSLRLVASGDGLRIAHDDRSTDGEPPADQVATPEPPSTMLDTDLSENRERIDALREARYGTSDLSDIVFPLTWKTVAALCVAVLLFIAAALSDTLAGLVAVGVALALLSSLIAIDHFRTRRRRG